MTVEIHGADVVEDVYGPEDYPVVCICKPAKTGRFVPCGQNTLRAGNRRLQSSSFSRTAALGSRTSVEFSLVFHRALAIIATTLYLNDGQGTKPSQAKDADMRTQAKMPSCPEGTAWPWSGQQRPIFSED